MLLKRRFHNLRNYKTDMLVVQIEKELNIVCHTNTNQQSVDTPSWLPKTNDKHITMSTEVSPSIFQPKNTNRLRRQRSA